MSWRSRSWKAWRRKSARAGASPFSLITRPLLQRMRITPKELARLDRAMRQRGDHLGRWLLNTDRISIDGARVVLHGEWRCSRPRHQGVLHGVTA